MESVPVENFCGFNTGLTCLGFLWQDGQKTPLLTLDGNNGQALGVNNRGQVVGYAENNIQDPNCVPPQVLDIRAVIWGPKAVETRELPPLPGDTISGATEINDRTIEASMFTSKGRQTRRLVTKGISFGSLLIQPDISCANDTGF
jgi:hypothetical protein